MRHRPACPALDEAFIRHLADFADRYPVAPDEQHFFTLHDRQNWARRTAYDINLILERLGSRDLAVCDVGGGYGLFSVGCARLGMRSILIEDFYDIERLGMLDATQTLLAEEGVEIMRRNMLTDDLGLEPETLDAVTSMHVLEHLPISPKPAFTQMVEALKPHGVFVLAGPNAVNLRKRIAVPLGREGWSPINEWYDHERFRGHVREPRAADLAYIARDLRLVNIDIRGTNFMATAAGQRRWIRSLAPALDALLRKRPSLCSELYLLAERPDLSRTHVV